MGDQEKVILSMLKATIFVGVGTVVTALRV